MMASFVEILTKASPTVGTTPRDSLMAQTTCCCSLPQSDDVALERRPGVVPVLVFWDMLVGGLCDMLVDGLRDVLVDECEVDASWGRKGVITAERAVAVVW